MVSVSVALHEADQHIRLPDNPLTAAGEHLCKKLAYDPVKDFTPITGLGKGGQVRVVRADSPYKSVNDLLAAARDLDLKALSSAD